MTTPDEARNNNTDEDAALANQGPIPTEPEEATDIGEEPGDLAPQTGPDRSQNGPQP